MKKKLPSRYQALVMPLILTGIMTLVVSGVSTLRVMGFAEGFFAMWRGAWVLSWVIAFPVMVVFLPVVKRAVSLFVEQPRTH